MRKHKLLINIVSALLIIVVLEVTTPQVEAQHAQPQGITLVVAIIVCLVVGVIIWGLIKMASKIPPPPKPDDGQPTNITAVFTIGADRVMQFQFDPMAMNTNTTYLQGGMVLDEVGNRYQLLCSYNLLSATNAAGPWTLDGTVTNWIGGTLMWGQTQCSIIILTNQEVALYNTNGELAAARRFSILTTNLSDAMLQVPIVMPPMHLPKEFYRLVLLEQ